MLEIKTSLGRKMVNEAMKTSWILNIILLILSIAMIVSSIISITYKKESDYIIIILLVAGIIFFVAAIFFLVKLLYQANKQEKMNLYSISKFYDNYLVNNVYQDGKVLSDKKLLFTDFIYYRLTKDFILIYISKKAFFPLDKVEHEKAILEILKNNNIKQN